MDDDFRAARKDNPLRISDAAAEHIRKEMRTMPPFAGLYPRVTPNGDGEYLVAYDTMRIGDVVTTEHGLYVLVRKEFDSLLDGKTLDYDGKRLYLTGNHHAHHEKS